MGRIALWHGTTADRAQRIRTEGFHPVDLSLELKEVAERYDVRIDALQQALADHKRFAAIQDVRSDLTWLAISRKAAERWAARAPEVRWEALWAVWWVMRGPDDPKPWRTPEAAGWHAQQYFEIQPRVIEMAVPDSCVLNSRGEALTPGKVRAHVRSGVPELTVRPPGDVRWIKEVWRARRPIQFTAVAGILRMSIDHLTDTVKAGRLPEPRPPLVPDEDWTWFEDELPSFVPQELLEKPI